jgi:hypothetical protein
MIERAERPRQRPGTNSLRVRARWLAVSRAILVAEPRGPGGILTSWKNEEDPE